MANSNLQGNLNFSFCDPYDPDTVNLLYINEENPSLVTLKFEITNNLELDLTLDPIEKTAPETQNDVSPSVETTPAHLEIKFRPGILSTKSLSQIDLSIASKERWIMSRPVFHDNREISLYFWRCNESLTLSAKGKASLTLRGISADASGGTRPTNVLIAYNNFKQEQDSIPVCGSMVLSLIVLNHHGKREAPLSICFASHNTILNSSNAEGDTLEIQVSNMGRDTIALAENTEFSIEIDAQGDNSKEPWAVSKKDEASKFQANILADPNNLSSRDGKKWYWKGLSEINIMTEEPKFTFTKITRQLGKPKALKQSIEQAQEEIVLSSRVESGAITFTSDPEMSCVAFPGTEWRTVKGSTSSAEASQDGSSGYSFCFRSDGNLILYNSSNVTPIWATGTMGADKLKFHPNGNFALYQGETMVWSTQTTLPDGSSSRMCFSLREDGEFVIFDKEKSDVVLFRTHTRLGNQSERNAVKSWVKNKVDNETTKNGKKDSNSPKNGSTEDLSFPSNENLIFVLSNVRSSLDSGQGRIRVAYKNIPGYADGYTDLNLYKTHLVERNKKIGIGKFPTVELDVEGTISATKTITAQSFVGVGAIVKDMIMMWSGNAGNIPTGWQLCDGNNSTPDLRGRFIMGVGDDAWKSRNEQRSCGEADSHSHTIDVPNISGTTANGGSHNHNFPSSWFKKDFKEGDRSGIDTRGGDVERQETESGGHHNHSFDITINKFDSGGSQSNRPRWYALCFIMYVGI